MQSSRILSNPFTAILEAAAAGKAGKENRRSPTTQNSNAAATGLGRVSSLGLCRPPSVGAPAAKRAPKALKPKPVASGTSSKASQQQKLATATTATQKRLGEIRLALARLETLTDGKLGQKELYNQFVETKRKAAKAATLNINLCPRAEEKDEDEGDDGDTFDYLSSPPAPVQFANRHARYSFGVSRFSLPGRLSVDTRRLSLCDLGRLSPSAESPQIVERGLEDDTTNFFEFCSVGVDRAILSGYDLPQRSSLQPPQLLDLFPIRDPSMPASVIPQIADYCFPFGVQLQLVPEHDAAALRSSPPRDEYHILQFTDAIGAQTFACCLTVTELIDAPNAVVVENLAELRDLEEAADTLKRFLGSAVRTSLRRASKKVAVPVTPAHSRVQAASAFGSALVNSISRWGSTRTAAKTPATSLFSRMAQEGHPTTSPSPSPCRGLIYNPLGLQTFFSDENNSGGSESESDASEPEQQAGSRRSFGGSAGGKEAIEDQFARPYRPHKGRSASSASAPISEAPRRLLRTQRAYCLISTKPLHTLLFKTLEAVAAKERHRPGESRPASRGVESASRLLTLQAEGRYRSVSAQQVGEAASRGDLRGRSHSTASTVSNVSSSSTSTLALALGSNSTSSSIASDAYFLSRKTRRDGFLRHMQTLVLDPSAASGMTEVSYPSYIKSLRVESRTTALEEWTCATLFCILPSKVIVQVMSMLLLEKSLIICGSDTGLVTAIGTAFTQLLRPFFWEGVFVPILPTSALEVIEAPVPFIVGTSATLPSLHAVSSTAAVLYLDDYLEQSRTSLAASSFRRARRRRFLLVPTDGDAAGLTDPAQALCSHLAELARQLRRESKPPTLRAASSRLVTFMLGMTAAEKRTVRLLLEAVEAHNRSLCGDLLVPGGWRKYGCSDEQTRTFDFVPELFLDPLRARLHFQEGLVHTQLFVSFLDRLKAVDDKELLGD